MARLTGYGDVDRFRRFARWKLSRITVATLQSVAREIVVLAFVSILVAGCHSRSGSSGPSIEFTRIPPAADSGPDKLDIIEGRVIGGAPGQKIVLYAKSGAWWVQPLVNEAFTKIQANSKWINSTHLGTEYAAMLVEEDYRPPVTMSELPASGGGVVAVDPAESDGAAGAVVDESAGPGEVDCCLAQAASASALMHSKRRVRFIDHLTVCRRLWPPRLLYSAGWNSTNSRKRRSITSWRLRASSSWPGPWGGSCQKSPDKSCRDGSCYHPYP